MDNTTNITSANSSMLNQTDDGVYHTVEFGFLGYFLSGLTLFGVVVSWTLNAVVITAINRTRGDRLKVKFLMQNAIIGDILLSISFGSRVVYQLIGIDDQDKDLSFVALCANTAYDFYAYFSAFYQILASMALAIDRLYSVLRPLAYHTKNYRAPVKICSIVFIAGLSMGISLPVILLKLEYGDDASAICYVATIKMEYTEEFLPYLILLTVVVTLCIHCSVLIVIAYHRRHIKGELGGRLENERARRKEATLAVTFFLVHFTFVLFYIPGALYFSVLTESLLTMPELNFYLSQTAILIYLLNTIVDPLIYIFRIRSIRSSVSQMFYVWRSKTYRKSEGISEPRESSDRPTSVATISAL